MNPLRRLRRRLRGRGDDRPQPEPDPKRAERLVLPPRPQASVGGSLPAIWCDDGLPTSLRSELETLPARIGNAAAPDRPGIHIRDAGTATGADLPGSAVWWWVEAVTEVVFERLAKDHGEAVIVPDESIREQLERLIPDVVGDTWVIGKGSATPLAALFLRYYPDRPDTYRLGIIGYNLKFIEPIATGLARNPGIDVKIDRWPVFAARPTEATDEILEWSDVVVCEWCGPNAVYASEHKRPEQRLVVRLHRFELETDHWRRIDPGQVDRFVTVGSHYQKLVLDRTGWPADKVVVIGNHVDDLQLRRAKLPDARFNIGMLGASSSRKRVDLAFNIIEELNRTDPRFHLRIKTALPRDEKWVWDNERERDYFDRELGRLEHDPLRSLVTFDPFGPDVASWLRNVGFVLSISDDESFHLAPAEGMASGAVPIIRNWPGADSVYSTRWVCSTTEEMIERVLELGNDPAGWQATADRARQEAIDQFAIESIVNKWADLLG